MFSLNNSLIEGIIHKPQNPSLEAQEWSEVVPEWDSGDACSGQGQVILAETRELVESQQHYILCPLCLYWPWRPRAEILFLPVLCFLERFF